MDNANEVSSSLSFASSYLSNGSSSHNLSATATTCNEQGANLETICLTKLSSSLEKLLLDPAYDYSDAEIVTEGIPVGVNKCILGSRSQFFHELFKKCNDSSEKEGKPKHFMSDLVPYGKVGYEAFNVILHYLYTGKLKPSPPEVSICVEETCGHDACRPAIDYAVELMCASTTFQVKELVLLVQRRLLDFVEKALVEDVIPILMAAFHCQVDQLLSLCLQRIAMSDLESVVLEKELPYEAYREIKSLRVIYQQEAEPTTTEVDPVHEKSIRRIHKALDSDDVELVELLLKESTVNLDDAYALHYACAYCDPKIVKEVLSLDLADVNRRNSRDHTVLHVAARRKEPSILVALLAKGACASDTWHGQTPLSICKQLTRLKDYNEVMVQGKESNKNRLCIDVLEREMRRNSMPVEMQVQSNFIADDMHATLDYLENRVAFARLFFPAEARVAMEIADADPEPKSLYRGVSTQKGSSGNLREVDLNETPSMQVKRLQERVQALHKTVETGRRYFPNCSEVLDKFLEDDDMPDVFFLEKGSAEEKRMKKLRFMELKEEVQKAFDKDIAENCRTVLAPSSSSSSSPEECLSNYKARKRSKVAKIVSETTG